MLLVKLEKQNAIQPPRWLSDSTMYLTIMGSNAYGVSSDNSDNDYYGFCIPPKGLIFPHTIGDILDFGQQTERFAQWQQHHVKDPNSKDIVHDFTVYNIVKYFQLCMENNPNIIDSLFTPRRCIIHSTAIGELVRENRKIFLHKGAWHKFKNYAYAQMHKIKSKVNAQNPARKLSIEQHGFDLKYAYHVVRLLNEIEQIMVEGDLDLERNSEQLKAVRRGEFKLEQIQDYFAEKEKHLEGLYATSTLQHSPNEAAIKNLLLECLTMHFGSLENTIVRETSADMILKDLQNVLAKYS